MTSGLGGWCGEGCDRPRRVDGVAGVHLRRRDVREERHAGAVRGLSAATGMEGRCVCGRPRMSARRHEKWRTPRAPLPRSVTGQRSCAVDMHALLVSPPDHAREPPMAYPAHPRGHAATAYPSGLRGYAASCLLRCSAGLVSARGVLRRRRHDGRTTLHEELAKTK
jgi:hypothetical protein